VRSVELRLDRISIAKALTACMGHSGGTRSTNSDRTFMLFRPYIPL
jgi:hypothetical protein